VTDVQTLYLAVVGLGVFMLGAAAGLVLALLLLRDP
jgi:hypothetical protein